MRHDMVYVHGVIIFVDYVLWSIFLWTIFLWTAFTFKYANDPSYARNRPLYIVIYF